MSPNDADGMANSVDLGQIAPLGAVWSESGLFAQEYLSENFRIIKVTGAESPKVPKFWAVPLKFWEKPNIYLYT